MTRLTHLAVGARLALGAGLALCLLAARPAHAQTTCNDASLVNPIVVSGSTAFEATLKQFAVKLKAETTPITIVLATGSNASGSCTGVATITGGGLDLGGTSGRFYTINATDPTKIDNNTCTFATGQKADLAISDVFYESCTNVPAKTADIMDISGPVQAMLFVVPKENTTTQYLTYKEAQVIYGCGANGGLSPFTDMTSIFCRDPNSGTQITVAKNIGVPESVLVAPICVNGGGTSGVITGLMSASDKQKAIGFIGADAYDPQRANLNSLAFQSLGQTKAYYSDSTTAVSDRRNVRDGHYTIWGYEHFISSTTSPNQARINDFVGYVQGTKTSPNFDAATLAGAAGTIPICAMKVKRSSDGGLLSPFTPPETCSCAFEAAITKTTPAGCTACTGTGVSTCTGGTMCHHGFCE
jgi:ABC-type phosphate transport system substrate-binding protein